MAGSNVFAEALASMPMPEYGVGTAWPTEECPFCAWRGKADEEVPPVRQGHAEQCPVRLARVATGLEAPIGIFTIEHRVEIDHGAESPGGRYHQGRCNTCDWTGTQGPRDVAVSEVADHRKQSRRPADGMEEGDYYYGDEDT